MALTCQHRLHRRQHLNAVNSMNFTVPTEVPAWRWDSMSQARYDADFFAVNVQNEVGEKTVNELDEFLSPEEAQYLRTNETSQYTLGSLFENAVPVSRKSRRKPGQTAVTCRPCPVCEVEFPESVLEEHVESCLHLSESQQNPAQASQAGPSGSGRESDGSLPEELLESFLQMQLPPEASDVFWSAYEFNLNERQRGVQDAFLAALEEALSWIPDEGSSTCSRDEALEVGAKRKKLSSPRVKLCFVKTCFQILLFF